MVNKLWYREITRKWLNPKIDPPHARVFSESKYQSHTSIHYFLYRWAIFLIWMGIIICSIFEWGSYKKVGNIYKWPIYLTNWDLTLGGIQSLLGACLVTRRWKMQKRPSFNPNELRLGRLEKSYWYTFVVTAPVATAVTLSYWGLVYNPKEHHMDPLNVSLHIVNTLLMLLDLCVTNIPLKLRWFWWSVPVGVGYSLFTVFYYLAGGTDKLCNPYIYKVLYWKNPTKAAIVAMGSIIFLMIAHCLLYFLVKLRDQLYDRLRGNLKQSLDLEIQRSISTKQVEIIV